uniref:Uncharacterized protein n=1 Tax=Neogobius melanostomus TaxID=47308 RepID=A0A8C6WE92_9GOBI
MASPNCRLETLRLNNCGLSEVSCVSLASALKSNPSHLRELDVRSNCDLKDSGVKGLCGYFQRPDCRLETLRLSSCKLTESSCSSLASALNSNPSHLTFLDVGWNPDLKDAGVEQLCTFLRSPRCRLQTLRLNWCSVSEPGCSALASARPSHLTYLDLGGNDQLKDPAVEQLCVFLQSPDCRLETIRLNSCGVSKSGCCSLAAALRSNPSHLREINLWYNLLNDSDLKALYDLRQNPRFRLDTVLR